MKVIDAERAIKEALAEGGAKFSELGLSAEGFVLFSDAKYMQCEPEQSKYMTAVLAIKTSAQDGSNEEYAIEDETIETEDVEDEIREELEGA